MFRDYSGLRNFLDSKNIVYYVNYPFYKMSSFNSGGNIGLYTVIENEGDLFQVVSYFISNDIDYLLMGDGNNILVADEGYSGVVISLQGEFEQFVVEDNYILTFASTRLERLSHEARIRNLTGFEFVALLSHTVGSSIASKLSAFGSSILDCIESVRVMLVKDKKISIEQFNKDEYLKLDNENYKSIKILSAVFRLDNEEPEKIDYKIDWYKYIRGSISPVSESHIGPIFEDDNEIKAHEMVERVGGLDMAVGFMIWHKRYPNYIVNTSNDDTNFAKTNDAIELIGQTRKKIEQHYEINPKVKVVVLRDIDVCQIL